MDKSTKTVRQALISFRPLFQLRNALTFIVLSLLKVYRLVISPMMGPHCRFEPTCSQYAIDAVTQLGIFRGSLLTLNRLRKCHPWHEGGFDPAPCACNPPSHRPEQPR